MKILYEGGVNFSGVLQEISGYSGKPPLYFFQEKNNQAFLSNYQKLGSTQRRC